MLSKERVRLSGSSHALEEPEVHALALIDRVDPDPQARHILVVHAQLNLNSAGKHQSVGPRELAGVSMHAHTNMCAQAFVTPGHYMKVGTMLQTGAALADELSSSEASDAVAHFNMSC